MTACLPSRRGLIRLTALATGALVLEGILGGCSSIDGEIEEDSAARQDRYDWGAVETDAQGRKRYLPGGALRSRTGIDVSDHNGDIDWQAVANDGVSFAMVRLGYRGYTEGGLFADVRAAENLAGARANGIAVGAYFFSSALDEGEAREEACFAASLLDGVKLDYPLAFDQELVGNAQGRANRLASSQYTANAVAFCDEVAAAGLRPMVYGNKGYLARIDRTRLGSTPLWYAEYGVERPTGSDDFSIWQYAADGAVAGIVGGVDLNIQFLA